MWEKKKKRKKKKNEGGCMSGYRIVGEEQGEGGGEGGRKNLTCFSFFWGEKKRKFRIEKKFRLMWNGGHHSGRCM